MSDTAFGSSIKTSVRRFVDGLTGGASKGGDSVYSPEHMERRARFDLRWQYFRGNHAQAFKPTADGVNDNVTENHIKVIVNTTVNFLFGKLPSFEIDSDVKDQTPGEKFLNTVWSKRGGWNPAQFLQELAQNGSVCGTAFVRIYPPVDSATKAEGYRLENVDPSLVEIITNPNRVSDVLGYHIIWQSGEIWYRHRIERTDSDTWSIIEERSAKGGDWVVDEEIEWPYDFPPMYHCKNLPLANSAWGMSDAEDADLNDAVNQISGNIRRVIRFHAHPKTIATGMNASELQTTSVDNFWTIPNTDARVTNLEMQSDLESSSSFRESMKSTLYGVSQTPNIDPTNVQVGAMSGFALRILFWPVLVKTDQKRETYGDMLTRVNHAMLQLAGIAELRPNIVWQDVLPISPKERAEELNLLTAAGASIYGAAKVAKYTEDEAQLLDQNAINSGLEQ